MSSYSTLHGQEGSSFDGILVKTIPSFKKNVSCNKVYMVSGELYYRIQQCGNGKTSLRKIGEKYIDLFLQAGCTLFHETNC